MKCQILFSGKNKKKVINLSSAELSSPESGTHEKIQHKKLTLGNHWANSANVKCIFFLF